MKDAPRLFRYSVEGEEDHHGHVKPITATSRSINDVIKYCIKDDDSNKNYLGNIDVDKYIATKCKCPDYEMVQQHTTKEAFKQGLVTIDRLKAYDHARSIAIDSTSRDPSKCVGLWLYREPGTGKSLYAQIRAQGERLYNKSHNKWWDGYSGEKYVLIDDLGEGFKSWTLLKTWVDVYEVSAEIKHGKTSLCYDEIIVTSNHTPRELIELNDKMSSNIKQQLIAAIKSRFVIQEFKEATFTLLTGLPIPRKRSKTLNKPLFVPDASLPTHADAVNE